MMDRNTKSLFKPIGVEVHQCTWGICTYEDTIDAEAYIEILERHMLPSRHCLCQQDNIRPHSAQSRRAWRESLG